MANAVRTTVVGVFPDREVASGALISLTAAGFSRDHIGIVSKDEKLHTIATDESADSPEANGAITGAVTGLGLGALAGLGVLSGVIPVIGPAIAAGTLGVVLSNAAAGAGIAGVVGALVGAGVPHEDAHYYQTEIEAGRLIMTVDAGSRGDAALAILRAHGAYDIHSASEARSGAHAPTEWSVSDTIS